MEERMNQENQRSTPNESSNAQNPLNSAPLQEIESREAQMRAELENQQRASIRMQQELDAANQEKQRQKQRADAQEKALLEMQEKALLEMENKQAQQNTRARQNRNSQILENEAENSVDMNSSILSNTRLNTSISAEGEKEIAKKVEEMTRKLVVKPPEVSMNPSNSMIKRSFSDLYQDKTIVDQIKFVTNRVKPNSSARVPDTIRTLDNYCQRFGYLSMGEVVDAPGKYFLGRRITNGKEGKIQYVVPNFEKNIFIETPDIGKNLCHFANRTVSKWNEYSKAEGELEVYVNMVKQTPIEDYEEMTVRKCSHGTTIYKILATLFYFYIEKKENILNLAANEVQQLKDIVLITLRDLEDVYQSLVAFLVTVTENKLIKFIINAKNEVKLALIASTGSQNENIIDTFIVDPNAYLDPSMMKNPRRETPKWIEKFSGEKSFANLFTTQKWEPVSDYMKPDNYFNF